MVIGFKKSLRRLPSAARPTTRRMYGSLHLRQPDVANTADGKVVPGLATSWEYSPDGRTIS